MLAVLLFHHILPLFQATLLSVLIKLRNCYLSVSAPKQDLNCFEMLKS